RLGETYREFGRGLGIDRSHEREVAIFQDADPVTRARTPSVMATHAHAPTRAWAVLMEDLSGARLLDSVDRPGDWTADDIRAAVGGIADIHAAWRPRVGELRASTWM